MRQGVGLVRYRDIVHHRYEIDIIRAFDAVYLYGRTSLAALLIRGEYTETFFLSGKQPRPSDFRTGSVKLPDNMCVLLDIGIDISVIKAFADIYDIGTRKAQRAVCYLILISVS